MIQVDFRKYFYLVSLLFCMPLTALAFENFDCVGNDPSWKLSITAQQIIFTQNTSSITLPAVEPKPAENMSIDHIRIFRTKIKNKSAIIVIQNQSCTEGISEDIFPYESLFITDDKVFHGCCSKKLLLSR